MKKNQFIILIALFVFAGTSLFAQSGKKVLADKTYDNFGYAAAINIYLSSLGKEETAKMDRKSMIRLANSFRLIGDSQNAEKWYSQIVETSNKPLYRLYYAQALQSNGNCDLARKYFLEYHEMIQKDSTNLDYDMDGNLDLRGASLAEGCNLNFTDINEIEIENMTAVNSENLDFSPMYYRDGIVFVSNQKIFKPRSNTDLWINHDFFDLYYSEPEKTGSYSDPIPFSKKINTRFHEGQVTFDQAGVTMFFTRNNFDGNRGKDRRGITKLKIYSAEWDGEGWGNIRELPFNNDRHSHCHPTLSADGMSLYFASDNKTKGYGGMDLYVSKFIGGRWSKPKNLGPEINTRGNEVFPYIHEDGTLYFSSNGHPGVGGLDIFSAKYIEVADTVVWTTPQNIGQPFNSKKDDFGFIVDTKKRNGFISSNRLGGKGGDDIYQFKVPVGMDLDLDNTPLVEWEAKLIVFDEEDNIPLEEAEISVSSCGEGEGFTAKLIPVKGKENEFKLRILNGGINDDAEKMLTNRDGEAYYGLSSDMDYCFLIEREGYEPADTEFSTRKYNINRKVNIEVPMAKLPECMKLAGSVINKVYKSIVPNAEIKIINKLNGEVTELLSDKAGVFNACLPCDAEFEVRGNKEEVGVASNVITSMGKGCSTIKEMTLALIELPPADKIPHPEALLGTPKPSSPFKINQKVIMENIFYDYNKDNFRPESVVGLDRLVEIMNKYPNLIVEIGSHTDSRGTDEYNKTLSQRRAENAVQYLKQQGINPSRLIARGYGEVEPVMPCEEDKCSELEHQLNRRTEFRVLKVNDVPDVFINSN